MKDKIKDIFSHQNILNIEPIQELWVQKGGIFRVYCSGNQYVTKIVSMQSLKTEAQSPAEEYSNIRKQQSYQVEQNWYSYALNKSFNFYIPKMLSMGRDEKYSYVVLEDLYKKKFIPQKDISYEQVIMSLEWLAKFHAYFINENIDGLWSRGSYWHVRTRPYELDTIDDQNIKTKAKKLDRILNKAQYKTIIHGDAKVANFLFKENDVTAVDYQYCGTGIGIKDVMSFLSSAYDVEGLEKNTERLLNIYFYYLTEMLDSKIAKEVEAEWRELYPYVVADFYRFLLGWKPDHWKINNYLKRVSNEVFERI